MKVLFLTYDGLTDPLGRSQILPYLTGLAASGHQIWVLSGEKKENYTANVKRVKQICQQASIFWEYLPYSLNQGLISHYRFYRSFLQKANQMVRDHSIRILHCRSYLPSMVGMRIKKRWGIPWIFDMRGFWIDERIEGNIWKRNNPAIWLLIRFLRYQEKGMFRDSRAIVSLTGKAVQIINQKFLPGNSGKLITIIPCCTDFQHFKQPPAKQKEEEKRKLSIPDNTKVLVYLGSIGTWYLLSEMLLFFKVLKKEFPQSLFLFITRDDPKIILSAAQHHGIQPADLKIIPAEREQIPFILSVADWGIAFIKPSYSKSASSPTKWAEYLAMGIPVITNKGIGDVEKVSQQLKGIILSPGFSEPDFKEIVRNLVSPALSDQKAIASEAAAFFDLPVAIRSYREVYDNVSRKNILFLASHRPGRAPNQRFRFEQYFSFLEDHGFCCHLSYLINEKTDVFLYRKGHLIKKAWFFYVTCWVKRWKILKNKNNYDVVFIAREALMTRSLFFEKRIKKSRAPLVFDFDDSIWLPNVSEANRLFRWLKNPAKTSHLIAIADKVIAGNQYLADYSTCFRSEVMIIPTTVDTAYFSPGDRVYSSKETITIGWTGSITTIQHFDYLTPVLIKLKQQFGSVITFKVIGDAHYQHKELEIQGLPWSLAEEKEQLSSFDIGIMPLPDTDWTRGKCGFKGLLCMSMGIPVVMSPVGVNQQIIADGVNGFLAASPGEWIEKLGRLILSENLRRSLGVKGRETVVQKYSCERWKQVYLDLFREISNQK